MHTAARRHCETAALCCAVASPVSLLVGFALLPTALGSALFIGAFLLLIAFAVLLDLAE